MPSTNETKPTAPAEKAASPNALDLEVKDANLIFTAAWNELVEEVGIEDLNFQMKSSG